MPVIPLPFSLSRITFKRREVAPPAPVYIGADDRLQTLTQSTVGGFTVQLRGRLLRPSGEIVPIAYEVAPALLGVTTEFPLSEGFLLTLAAFTPEQTAQPNYCYVSARIVRGRPTAGEPYQVLFGGTISQNAAISWPGGPQLLSEDGPGNTRIVGIGNPAPGADWIATVPQGTRYELLSVRGFFTASAVVANRFPRLIIDSGAGGTVVYQVPNLQAIAASTFYSLSWFAGVGYANTVGAMTQAMALPDHCFLRAGWRFLTSTVGIDPGDQWSAIGFLVREWPSWHS